MTAVADKRNIAATWRATALPGIAALCDAEGRAALLGRLLPLADPGAGRQVSAGMLPVTGPLPAGVKNSDTFGTGELAE